jgi:hypothetical protein
MFLNWMTVCLRAHERKWHCAICPITPNSLAQFYLGSGKDVRAQLSESSLQLPHYVNLDWRLDVQLGSRALRQQFEPTLMLELETQKPSTANFDGGSVWMVVERGWRH